MGNGLVFTGWVSHLSTSRSWVPALPNFWDFSIYAYTLCRRTTKFVVVTHVGEGRVFWGQPLLPSQVSGVSALPNFRVLLYFCLHPLTQNDQVQLGDTDGEWHIFRKSATPLRLCHTVCHTS